MASSIGDTFQAFSSVYKENLTGGFFRVHVRPQKNGGVDFHITRGVGKNLREAGEFYSIKTGDAALVDFRRHGPIVFEWMRSVSDSDYRKRAKKSK